MGKRVRTLSSEQSWQSDDGQITKYDIVLEHEGKSFKSQTYSKKISEVGFEGEVESYQNKRGDTLVRQPQREGGYNSRGGGSTKSDDAMYRTSALKNATELAGALNINNTDSILRAAAEFYEWLKGGTTTSASAQQSTTSNASTQDVVPEEIDNEPIDLSSIPF